MIITRKKIVAIILVTILLIAAAVFLGNRSGTVGDTEPQGTEAQHKEQEVEKVNEPPKNEAPTKIMDKIYDKTYIYYDEFAAGKPVTYTFYSDGTMVAYYWEDTESESIPLGSQWGRYLVNEEATEIYFDWDDGTEITEMFEIKNNGAALVIGDAKFELSDRKIYVN